MVALADLEHVRSIRPSYLIQIFLFFSIFCDLPRIRTQWMLPDNAKVAPIFSAAFGLKVLLIFIESLHKYSHSTMVDKNVSPEEIQGVFGDTFFTWLNPLFFQGYKRNLSMDDLYPVDDGLRGQTLYERLQSHWLKGKLILSPKPSIFSRHPLTRCSKLQAQALPDVCGPPDFCPRVGHGLCTPCRSDGSQFGPAVPCERRHQLH